MLINVTTHFNVKNQTAFQTGIKQTRQMNNARLETVELSCLLSIIRLLHSNRCLSLNNNNCVSCCRANYDLY